MTVWEPPARLAYLWHLRRDRADATEVEIRFIAELQPAGLHNTAFRLDDGASFLHVAVIDGRESALTGPCRKRGRGA